MKTPFKPDPFEGDESIMSVEKFNTVKVIVHQKSGDITIEYKARYSQKKLEKMAWTKIEKLVEENGGEYTTKKNGIKYLTTL